MYKFKSPVCLLFLTLFLSIATFSGCAVEAAKKDFGEVSGGSAKTAAAVENQPKGVETKTKTKIEIKPNSPAETVEAFFRDLRENHFREAIFLTNLRPAIEGLTDAELKDFQVDFASLAEVVSDDIVINGEVISGDNATVMAKIPDPSSGKTDVQTFRLKKQNDYWTILTVDEAAEKIIRQEGKNYLFNLRLETHQSEAKKTLDRISRAEMVYAMQNHGAYTDLQTLVGKNLIPVEMLSAEDGGYNYRLTLAPDLKHYQAAAAPAEYGKTGKISYLFEITESNQPKMTEKDNGGKFLTE